MSVAVSGLALTPVKGTRLRAVEELRLDHGGVRENRRFFLIDSQGRMVNGSRLGKLQTVVSDYSDRDRRLRLELPDGQVLEDQVVLGPTVRAEFYGDDLEATLIEGPWSEAVSQAMGRRLRLVEAGEQGAVDRLGLGHVTLISRASLERLAAEGALDGIDSRRFRMLIEVDCLEAHAEDSWVGQAVRIGQGVVRFEGHVGRCVITTRNPETGIVDARTLKILGRYRREVQSTEPLPFGIYGRVVEPGAVRLGDPVAVEG
jgi:uncharacterized protein YcbX